MHSDDQHYVGRFAPSPSGPLHMGSLLCALASFLDAKAHHGSWLLRIEDIDPPREIEGASEAILHALSSHGLYWDGDILYQSQRSQAYHQALQQLAQRDLSYRCSCTRKRLNQLEHNYDNHCRELSIDQNTPCAIRLHTANACTVAGSDNVQITFEDLIQGHQTEDFATTGDFVIHRKDGLFAYQLAVVVDDIYQGITDIVRGSDLLDTTAKQVLLMRAFASGTPRYAHIPLLVNQQGLKLSKQNHAEALAPNSAHANIIQCLQYLGMSPPQTLHTHTLDEILQWAIEHWSLRHIPRSLNVTQQPPSPIS